MNRRTLFGNLLAAGAAFVGAPAVARAAPSTPQQPVGRVRYPGDTDLANRCLGCGWVGEWSNDPAREQATRSLVEMRRHFDDVHDGAQVPRETIWRPHDPLKTSARIRESRAEGYERGHAVASAAAESKSQDSDPGWLVWHADGSKEHVRTITLTETDPLRSETEFYVNRGPGKIQFLYTKNGAPVQDPEYNRALGGDPFDFESKAQG